MTEKELNRARSADRKMTVQLVKMVCDASAKQAEANAQVAKVLAAFLEIYTAKPGSPAEGWVNNDMAEFLKEYEQAQEVHPNFPAGAPQGDQIRWLEHQISAEE